MLNIFCALRRSDELRAIRVCIESTDTVMKLKNAIREASCPELDSADADALTLVRVCRAGAETGVLTKKELRKWPECLRLDSYGEDPEWEEEKKALSQLQEYLGILPSKPYYIASNRRNLEPATQPTITNLHMYSTTQSVFELDSDYLSGSGLLPARLVLYCRKSFHDQFKFLRERVLLDSQLGYVLGPPDTGKSATSLAFVSVMENDFPDWTITWIHLSKSGIPVCARIVKKQKWSFVLKDIDLPYLDAFLEEVEGMHVVFLDGFVYSNAKHITIKISCSSWREEDLEKRRLAIVCAMVSRFKISNYEDEMVSRVEEFDVDPWKLEEYLTAAQHIDEIFCALSNGLKLRGFTVAINTAEADVYDIKEAVHTKNALARVAASRLTLVRICKAGAESGGLDDMRSRSGPIA
ncbi:hypothetical protein HDU81_004108 [Chytriomyces hyalinus]|nr:hypothetical protein HDU81_004108 [Chytriomyces hyalinus]